MSLNTVAVREKLCAPFPAEEIEWRVGNESKSANSLSLLAYVDARAVRRRLDDVFGPLGWSNSIGVVQGAGKRTKETEGEFVGGIVCNITVIDGNRVIQRSDGSDETDFEPFKGGISGAFRRAAAAFGIGAYLYGLPEVWVSLKNGGLSAVQTREHKRYHRMKNGEVVYWREPQLPAEFLPRETTVEVEVVAPSANGHLKESVPSVNGHVQAMNPKVTNNGSSSPALAHHLWKSIVASDGEKNFHPEIVAAMVNDKVSGLQGTALMWLNNIYSSKDGNELLKIIQSIGESTAKGEIETGVRDSLIQRAAERGKKFGFAFQGINA